MTGHCPAISRLAERDSGTGNGTNAVGMSRLSRIGGDRVMLYPASTEDGSNHNPIATLSVGLPIG